MPNSVDILLNLRGNLAAQLKAAREGVTSFGEGASTMAAGAIAGFDKLKGAAESGFKFLEGDCSQLGAALGSLPGPVGAIGGAIGSFLGDAADKTMKLSSQVATLE